MVFDKMVREMYLQCCLECGLEVETEPLQHVRHNMSKDEALDAKLAQKQRDLEAKEQQLNSREKELNACVTEIENERNAILQTQSKTAYLDDFWEVYPTAKQYYDKYVSERRKDFENSPYFRKLMREAHKEVKLNENLAPKQQSRQQYKGWDIGD